MKALWPQVHQTEVHSFNTFEQLFEDSSIRLWRSEEV